MAPTYQPNQGKSITFNQLEDFLMNTNNRIHLNASIQEINQMTQNYTGKIIIWGAGCCAKDFINMSGYTGKVDYFVDVNPQKYGIPFLGKPVYDKQRILQDNNKYTIVIIATMYFKDVLVQLEKLNFSGIILSAFHITHPANQNAHKGLLENISQLQTILTDEKSRMIVNSILQKRQNNDIDYADIYESNQYFVHDIIKKNINAVFIDGGAFNTDTVDQFIKFQNGQFKKIYSFEMDIINYTKIDQSKYDERVQFLNYGLWDEETQLHYSADTTNSAIEDAGNLIAKCTCIDHICQNDKVTFIKMDIEGAEQKALSGAKNIIMRDKPQLAICVYHKPNDIWEIPFMLKDWVPEYQLYLRHHSPTYTETVLYAVCKENN